ncbi:hypothetical protein K439DRAFT_368296 [Ramaria rubella]|nr:hypothetical protein K439DRAFT_368296 [Ramaria rubella]
MMNIIQLTSLSINWFMEKWVQFKFNGQLFRLYTAQLYYYLTLIRSRTTRQIAYSDGERVCGGNNELRHQHTRQRLPTWSVGSQPFDHSPRSTTSSHL